VEREEVGGLHEDVKLAVDKASKGSKRRKEGVEGIADSVVEWGFREVAGEKVVSKGVTGLRAVAAGGELGCRKNRESEFALEQSCVEIVGEAVVGKSPREGVQGDAGKRGQQGGKGKGLGGAGLLDCKEHGGGLVVGVDAALESAENAGVNKLLGGGFRGGRDEEVMGGDEERQVVAVSTDEGGGVPGGRPSRKRAGVNQSELPVVGLVSVGAKAASGKAEGPSQWHKDGSDGSVRVLSIAVPKLLRAAGSKINK
jgi:hypothetical protein